MAQETYHLNNNSNDVFITVKVSTPGIASTEVDNTVNGNTTQVAVSEDAMGKIDQARIGKASSLNHASIEIDTDIDLIIVRDKNLWPVLFNNLVIKYTLEGGKDGTQIYTCESDDKSKSDDGRIIHVAKIIELKIM
jgi:hypothetical protein